MVNFSDHNTLYFPLFNHFIDDLYESTMRTAKWSGLAKWWWTNGFPLFVSNLFCCGWYCFTSVHGNFHASFASTKSSKYEKCFCFWGQRVFVCASIFSSGWCVHPGSQTFSRAFRDVPLQCHPFRCLISLLKWSQMCITVSVTLYDLLGLLKTVTTWITTVPHVVEQYPRQLTRNFKNDKRPNQWN